MKLSVYVACPACGAAKGVACSGGLGSRGHHGRLRAARRALRNALKLDSVRRAAERAEEAARTPAKGRPVPKPNPDRAAVKSFNDCTSASGAVSRVSRVLTVRDHQRLQLAK